MNENNLENQKVDRKILKRLLSYTKPFIGYILLALALLFIIVGIELLRPVLVGKAVDDVITDYHKDYYISDTESEDSMNIGDYYVSLESNNAANEVVGTIIYKEDNSNQYYLALGIDGTLGSEIEDEMIISQENDGAIGLYNGVEYQVIKINSEDIKALRGNDLSELIRITIIYVVILGLSLVISYFQTLILHITGQKIIYNIRDEVFSHLQKQSVQFFNKNAVGRLVTRVTNDTETLNEMYTNVVINTVKNVLLLVGLTVMMFVYSVRLSLAVFAVMPLVVIATFLFRFFSRKIYRDVRERVSGINTFLSEHISGMKIVQLFVQEEEKLKEFDESNVGLRKAYIKQLILFSIYRPFMYVTYILSLIVVLGYGGMNVIDQTMTIGTLVIFLQYMTKFFQPIQELAEQFNVLQAAMASAEKIFGLLDEDTSVKEHEDAVKTDSIKGSIEFKNVWFAYNDEDWVLKDISFKVEAGEVIAFVGATGAGKSSILNLLSRYYEIQKGEILIDGINIKDYSIDSLRTNIGQMLQDVFLFSGDVKSNIRLKNDDITFDEIVEASKYINAHKFIEKLPNKYDEEVNERGSTLSAGQRQLLSFARTLAVDPSILILDEATSSIDTETEKLIQDALLKLMEGRTTLVVAHRLSTIQHADKIIVLHKGHIKEIGNHQELLAHKGIYHQLYQLQYQDIS